MSSTSTKTQHYISQAEQRLNAINPKAEAKNQRIYQFRVLDRDKAEIKAMNKNGVRIQRSLAMEDLYSFDVTGILRDSFEDLFQLYEDSVAAISKEVLQILSSKQEDPVREEILPDKLVKLFIAKFLSFIRNPQCVSKMLNTFGDTLSYNSTNCEISRQLGRVLTGNRPQQEYRQYDQWLRTIFFCLSKLDGDLPWLESVVAGLFQKNYVQVDTHHYTFDDDRYACLLSDRGFNIPKSDSMFAFEFNISSRVFARYSFCDPKWILDGYELNPSIPTPGRRIFCHYKLNNIEELIRYNQTTVYQCASNVFASGRAPIMS